MVVRLSDRFTWVRVVQATKAPSPMVCRFMHWDRSTEVRAVQVEKAAFPMVCRFVHRDRSTEVRPDPWNA